ncbi:MAG: glycosyltransferase family 2 protein [Synergistetes bacterium]|nr:glycosyltransferase family 2 protein [Synergistota bacterium]
MELKKGISAIVHTFNEEHNIRNCLESVKWADEIVIIDMYSEDKTVEIAREYTDKIYFFERKGYADPARQFGIDQASCKWILIVDADEMIPKRLSQRLKEIAEKDEADVVYIPRRNFLFGKPLKGGVVGDSSSNDTEVF